MFHNSLTAQTRYFGCTLFYVRVFAYFSIGIDKVAAVLVRRFHKCVRVCVCMND